MKTFKEVLSWIGVSILLAFVIACGIFLASSLRQPVNNLGGWQDVRVIEDVTQTATTTGSYCDTCPVKILTRSANRQYVAFVNTSDVPIYLYFSNEALVYNFTGLATATTNATGTVTQSGIYLAASGGRYELLDNNLIINEVWATSTAGINKGINVIYK